MSNETTLQQVDDSAAILTTKYFTPWCQGDGVVSLDGLMIRHVAKGVENGYFWDEKMGKDKPTMASKDLREWYLGDNTLQVWVNLNGVLVKSDEMKTDWSKYANETQTWVNFYYRGDKYTVEISLDGKGNQVSSKLT